MLDRIFSAVLAFGVLAAATGAIAAAWFERPMPVVQLPRVHVTAARVVALQSLAQCDNPASTTLR